MAFLLPLLTWEGAAVVGGLGWIANSGANIADDLTNPGGGTASSNHGPGLFGKLDTLATLLLIGGGLFLLLEAKKVLK